MEAVDFVRELVVAVALTNDASPEMMEAIGAGTRLVCRANGMDPEDFMLEPMGEELRDITLKLIAEVASWMEEEEVEEEDASAGSTFSKPDLKVVH